MTIRTLTLSADSKAIFDMLHEDPDNHPAMMHRVGEIVLSALMTGEASFRDRLRLEMTGGIEIKRITVNDQQP